MAKCLIGPAGGGKVTVSGLAANKILQGTTVTVKQGSKTVASVAGSIPGKAAATYTPKTTNQTIAAGQYLAEAQIIKGDANLLAANILTGKSIFGVAGGLTVLAAGSNYGKNNAAFSGSWWYNGMQTVYQGSFTGSLTFPGTPVIAFVMKANTYASVTIGGQTVKNPGVTTITTFSNNSVSWSAGSANDGIVYVVLGAV